MGDTRKRRKTYKRPTHPWQKPRIVEERELLNEFGLKNKKEAWKMDSTLKRYKDQVKNLTVREDKQAIVERKNLINKLNNLGLLEGDQLDQVLSMGAKDICERRLQTIVYKKGLARSVKQARQFIVHNHILVNNKPMTIPGYLVKASEETSIEFHGGSSLYDIEHPERIQPETKKDRLERKKAEAVTDEDRRKLTEEEIEAKEIAAKEREALEKAEEEKEIKKLENETPEKEVQEIKEEGKTEMDKLKK